MPDQKPITLSDVKPLSPDDLEWPSGSVMATAYDDIYFSTDNGLAESRFVFLDGNRISERWKPDEHICIAETGFGTGLNFLATWQRWIDDGRPGRFTFVSAEANPLTRAAITRALQRFPELSELLEQMLASWPPASRGFHLRQFEEGRVRLLLLFGDAAEQLAELDARVDVWYLDGFAPAKNPTIWSDAVFNEVKRLSKAGTSFATFTAASLVSSKLSIRGFNVSKTAGYGKKRERLVGRMVSDPERRPQHWWYHGAGVAEPGAIVIIGAGIAGAMIADAFNRRGIKVTLISGRTYHSASSMPAAVLAPRFHNEDSLIGNFGVSAFFNATEHPLIRGHMIGKGGLTLAPSAKLTPDHIQKLKERALWETHHLTVSSDGVSVLPRSGAVDAVGLLEQVQQANSVIHADVDRIAHQGGSWLTYGSALEPIVRADTLILATGFQDQTLLELADLPLEANRGQMMLFRGAAGAGNGLPRHGIEFGGYLSPVLDGGVQQLGSSFDRMPDPNWQDVRALDDGYLSSLLSQALDVDTISLSPESHWIGRRGNLLDHMPAAGPLANRTLVDEQLASLAIDASFKIPFDDNLYHKGLQVLTGLGSRGFQYAPLIADAMVAKILGEPYPLPIGMQKKFNSGRFIAKTIVQSRKETI